jgi:myo-inositol 2-dehydrogenase / D-chiro-inositol 1-dehydrogenase
MVSAQVQAGPGGDPLLITMTTGAGQIVSTEVTMHAVYGYHVHAEVLCKSGVVGMAAPTRVLTDHAQHHGHGWPLNWVPRFAEAYRLQMTAWLASVQDGAPVGASAWDGYAASAIAEQVVPALHSGQKVTLTLADRPALYA